MKLLSGANNGGNFLKRRAVAAGKVKTKDFAWNQAEHVCWGSAALSCPSLDVILGAWGPHKTCLGNMEKKKRDFNVFKLPYQAMKALVKRLKLENSRLTELVSRLDQNETVSPSENFVKNFTEEKEEIKNEKRTMEQDATESQPVDLEEPDKEESTCLNEYKVKRRKLSFTKKMSLDTKSSHKAKAKSARKHPKNKARRTRANKRMKEDQLGITIVTEMEKEKEITESKNFTRVKRKNKLIKINKRFKIKVIVFKSKKRIETYPKEISSESFDSSTRSEEMVIKKRRSKRNNKKRKRAKEKPKSKYKLRGVREITKYKLKRKGTIEIQIPVIKPVEQKKTLKEECNMIKETIKMLMTIESTKKRSKVRKEYIQTITNEQAFYLISTISKNKKGKTQQMILRTATRALKYNLNKVDMELRWHNLTKP